MRRLRLDDGEGLGRRVGIGAVSKNRNRWLHVASMGIDGVVVDRRCDRCALRQAIGADVELRYYTITQPRSNSDAARRVGHGEATDDNYLQFAPDGFIDVGTYHNPGFTYFCGWKNHVVTPRDYFWTISVTNTGDVQEKRSDGVLFWHTDGTGGTAYGPCSPG